MTRSEISKLAKYGEECLEDSVEKPEVKDKLLMLAEEQFNKLITEFKVECVEPQLGYLYCRLGDVKYKQELYEQAEKTYLDSLDHLSVRGEYCQDRARAHIGLARTYIKLNDFNNAREHFIKAIHIYDSLAMNDKIKSLAKDFRALSVNIKEILPAKQINENGEPTECRECGGSEFKKIRVDNEKIAIYECSNCGCRNVIILDMLDLMSSSQ